VFAAKGRLVLAIVFLFIYVPFLVNHGLRAADRRNVDLPSFYYATDAVFNEGLSPYAERGRQALQAELGQTVFPYLYPPPSLLLLAPFSWCSYDGLKGWVLAANHLCVLALIYLLLFRIFAVALPGAPPSDPTKEGREQAFLRWLTLPLLVLYTLQFHPLVVTLGHGQINLFVLVLICLFWLALRSRASAWVIGLPLAGAILLKTYPVLFLPLLLIRRKFKVAAYTTGYLALLVLLSLVVLPAKTWSDWLSLVLPTGGYGQEPYHLFSPAMPWNQSLNGFTARLFLHPNYALSLNPGLARVIPYIAAAAILGTVAWLALRLTRDRETRYVNDELVVVLLSIFLVAPLSWEHHLVFVLPAALLAIIHIVTGRASLPESFSVLVAIGLLAWPMPYLFEIQGQGLLNLFVSLKFFAVVGLWVYFVRRLLRKAVPARA